MGKSKNKNNCYNVFVIEILAEKYGLSQSFIRMSLGGIRNSPTSETIREEYYKINIQFDKMIKEIKNKNIKNI